jgi:hypothetical protein
MFSLRFRWVANKSQILWVDIESGTVFSAASTARLSNKPTIRFLWSARPFRVTIGSLRRNP